MNHIPTFPLIKRAAPAGSSSSGGQGTTSTRSIPPLIKGYILCPPISSLTVCPCLKPWPLRQKNHWIPLFFACLQYGIMRKACLGGIGQADQVINEYSRKQTQKITNIIIQFITVNEVKRHEERNASYFWAIATIFRNNFQSLSSGTMPTSRFPALVKAISHFPCLLYCYSFVYCHIIS